MTTEEMENLDSETQDNNGDGVADVESEDASSETDSSDLEAELEKARKIAEDQRRRAEKAEQKLKSVKTKSDTKDEPKSEGQKETQVSGDQLTKEEAILYARGLSEDGVEKAKSIAKIENVNLLVAAESDYFKIWKEKQEKEVEAKETQLGASRGSSKKAPKKDFGTPGLTPAEHKALWRSTL